MQEVRELVAAGYKDITLLGQNVNSYGNDLDLDYHFPDLLEDIDKIPGEYLIRFMSSHPKDATNHLFDVMSKCSHVAKQLHLPFQSGNDRVLKEMNRRYTREKYLEEIRYAKSVMPGLVLTSDVIIGFPGETEEDFRTTYDFLAGLEPAFLHIFPFSERPGTPAVEMPGKVQASVATRRAAELEALCAKLHGAFCARAVGSEDSVLFESTRRGGMMFGFTGNYRRVKAPYDKARVNTVCRVRLGAMDESHDLMGEIRD